MKQKRYLRHIFLYVLTSTLFIIGTSSSALAAEGSPLFPTIMEPAKMTLPPKLAFQPPAEAESLNDFLPPESQAVNISVELDNEVQHTVDNKQDTGITINDSLVILIEKDTFDQPVDIAFTLTKTADPELVGRFPLLEGTASSEAESNKEALQRFAQTSEQLIQFQIEVIDEKGQLIADFAKPVRLAVDLRQFGLNLAETGGSFYLAYESQPGSWEEMPVNVHQEDGLISLETTHFSNWTAGWRPEAWALHWTPPAVSAFSGVSTYQFPVNIPPGRNGFQPVVGISYSSSSLGGAVEKVPLGTIATGWSLNEINITRSGIQTKASYISYPDKFRLVLNGAGYRLIAGGNVNGVDRFFVEDAPGIRVYNYGGRTSDDPESYWVVKTADGVRYRLGYTSDSVSIQEWELNNGGRHDEIIAWHVDTATDPFGNQINYDYIKPERFENWGYWCPWGGVCNMETWTTNSQVAEITYNFEERITNLPAPHNVGRLSNNPAVTAASRIVFVYDEEDTRLGGVEVYHHNTPQNRPIRRYNIEAHVGSEVNPFKCDVRKADGSHETRYSQTRVVDSITEEGWDPVNNQWRTLPATTFNYAPYYHFQESDQGCFIFRYLSSVENGYGGKVEFSYTADGRQFGDYENCRGWTPEDPPCDPKMPEMGYHHRVTQMRTYDGRHNGTPTWTNYDYIGACYDDPNAPCRQPESEADHGSLIGHEEVIVTNYGYNVEPLTQTKTNFHTDLDRLGKPYYNEFGIFNESGGGPYAFQKTETVYHIRGDGDGIDYYFGPNNDIRYVPTKSVTKTEMRFANSISSKVEYYYNPNRQGNERHGNVTDILEFDNKDDTTPYRTTRNFYFPNDTDEPDAIWMVDKVASTAVYENNSWVPISPAVWTYYDQTSDHRLPPTQGTVRRVRQLTDLEGGCNAFPGGPDPECEFAYLTIDSQMQYDVYGNPKLQTAYAGYGYHALDDQYENVADIWGTNGRTTTIFYEDAYHLYPVKSRNPLNHDTLYEIYGFENDSGTVVPVNGFQSHAGTLKQVSDPNGVTIKYEYDPFGRLHAIYDGYSDFDFPPFAGFGDTSPWNGNPVTQYRYWDNSWNHPETFLDPAQDNPFFISTMQRPGNWPNPGVSNGSYAFMSTQFLDGFGRPIQSRSIYNAVEGEPLRREIYATTEYNALGQVTCESVPFDVPFYYDRGLNWPDSAFIATPCSNYDHTAYEYYALGQVEKTIAPDGTETIFNHFINNNLVIQGFDELIIEQTIDANDHVINRLLNSRGNLLQVREYSGTISNPTLYATTEYVYDLTGNLTDVYDDALNHTFIIYDDFGRKIGMDDPDMGNDWEYEYDALGNLTRQEDANNAVICFEYDVLNRLVSKAEDSSPGTNCPATLPTSGPEHLASYVYDTAQNGLGQLHQVSWGSTPNDNKDVFSYDSLGRMTKQERYLDGGDPYTIETTAFDPLQRPLTTIYPDGEEITTFYDREGENRLRVGVDNLVADIRYNAQGQMTFLDRTNALDTTYTYYDAVDAYPLDSWQGDSNFRLSQIQHGTSGGEQFSLAYHYDTVGNIFNVTTNSLVDSISQIDTQNFTYDHLNRLDLAAATGGPANYSHNYDYDEIGNITHFGDSVDNYEYIWDSSSPCVIPDTSLPHAVKQIGSSYFCYDDNGNMTERHDQTGNFSQTFDVENRLVAVEDITSGSVTQFFYDASGQRVKTVELGGKVIYTPFPNFSVESSFEDQWQDVGLPNLDVTMTANEDWMLATSDSSGWADETLTVANNWTAVPDPAFPGTSTYNGTGVGDPLPSSMDIDNNGAALALNNLASGQLESITIELDGSETDYTVDAFLKGEFTGMTGFGTLAIIAIIDSDPETAVTVWESTTWHDETWQPITGNINVPKETRELQLQIVATQINGWAALDELTVSTKSNQTPEIVYNSSFENAGEWTEQADINFPATSIWRGTEGPAAAYAGNYSYVFSNLSHTRLTSPRIEVTGDRLTANIWINGHLPDDLAAADARFVVAYFDRDGQQLANDILWQTNTLGYSSSWQQVGGTVIPPTTATSLELFVESSYGNGWIALNDASLIIAQSDCPKASCADEYTWNFDQPDQWNSSSQAEFPAGSIWYTVIQHSNDIGDYGYILGNETRGVVESSQFAVTGGDSYQVEAWARSEFNPVGSSVTLLATFLNSTGNIVAQTPVWSANGNIERSGWVKHAKMVTAPPTAVQLRLELDVNHISGWVAMDGMMLGKTSQAIPTAADQLYALSALVSGDVTHPSGLAAGQLSTLFYGSSGTQIGSSSAWSSSNYNQTTPTWQGGQFTTPSNTDSLRVAYLVSIDNDAQDNGWLAVEELSLTAFSEPFTVVPGRTYGFWSYLRGQLDDVAGETNAQLAVYNTANLAQLVTTWETSSYNEPVLWNSRGGMFTSPGGTSSVRLGMQVNIDRGWMAFNDPAFEARSDFIPVNANQTYNLTALIAGDVSAPVGERSGLFVQTYYDSNHNQIQTGDDPLWDVGTYQEATPVQQGGQFITPPGTAYIRIWMVGVVQHGWLTFSDLSLQELTQVENTVTRSTYSFAGQAIAVRVTSEPAAADDGLHYMYSDHLGSTSILSDETGDIALDSIARYLPFGGFRVEPGTNPDITDMGYTGHKHNNTGDNDLGLIYMNARYYVPGIGRFASADMIVPNPSNPQAYNRYSYVYNNPLILIDPSGHCATVGYNADTHTPIYDSNCEAEWNNLINAGATESTIGTLVEYQQRSDIEILLAVQQEYNLDWAAIWNYIWEVDGADTRNRHADMVCANVWQNCYERIGRQTANGWQFVTADSEALYEIRLGVKKGVFFANDSEILRQHINDIGTANREFLISTGAAIGTTILTVATVEAPPLALIFGGTAIASGGVMISSLSDSANAQIDSYEEFEALTTASGSFVPVVIPYQQP